MQFAVANFNHLRFLDNPCQPEHFAIVHGANRNDISKVTVNDFSRRDKSFFSSR